MSLPQGGRVDRWVDNHELMATSWQHRVVERVTQYWTWITTSDERPQPPWTRHSTPAAAYASTFDEAVQGPKPCDSVCCVYLVVSFCFFVDKQRQQHNNNNNNNRTNLAIDAPSRTELRPDEPLGDRNGVVVLVERELAQRRPPHLTPKTELVLLLIWRDAQLLLDLGAHNVEGARRRRQHKKTLAPTPWPAPDRIVEDRDKHNPPGQAVVADRHPVTGNAREGHANERAHAQSRQRSQSILEAELFERCCNISQTHSNQQSTQYRPFGVSLVVCCCLFFFWYLYIHTGTPTVENHKLTGTSRQLMSW